MERGWQETALEPPDLLVSSELELGARQASEGQVSLAQALSDQQASLALQGQAFRELACQLAIPQRPDLPPWTAWTSPVGTPFQDRLCLTDDDPVDAGTFCVVLA